MCVCVGVYFRVVVGCGGRACGCHDTSVDYFRFVVCGLCRLKVVAFSVFCIFFNKKNNII